MWFLQELIFEACFKLLSSRQPSSKYYAWMANDFWLLARGEVLEKCLFGATFVVNKLTADFSQKPLDGLKR
jgi:hypothetical protein